ncbi:unnamed protein product, partial [marine sediment metagenome]
KSKIGKLRLDEKALKDNLGEGNTIFVGSSTDMWAKEIPVDWIGKVLLTCCAYPDNTYLFQTKNPRRFMDWEFPKNVILATTIETNRDFRINKAPPTDERMRIMKELKVFSPLMISIEPIMRFDMDMFVSWIKDIKPKFVSIGADSKNSDLPEPNKREIDFLIKELKKFTEVKVKDNLRRIT